MNKKILAGVGIGLILAIVVFLNVDSRSDEDKMLDAISWFIYEQTGDFEDYKALEFVEITNEMLLGDVDFKRQFEVVQDTVKQKTTLLQAYNKLPESWSSQIDQFEELKPDQLDDYLKFNAKLDMALSAVEDRQTKEQIEKQLQPALNLIEAKLQALNLSIFSIDLSAKETLYYLHRFALDGNEQLSVFEIDSETQNVISYKRIG